MNEADELADAVERFFDRGTPQDRTDAIEALEVYREAQQRG